MAHENDLKVIAECADVPRLKEAAAAIPRPLVLVPTSFTADLLGLVDWLHTQDGRVIVILEHGSALPESVSRHVDGVVTRAVSGPQLLDTLRRVAAGERVSQRTSLTAMPTPDHAGANVVKRLTPKELQIVSLVSEGAKNREIAMRLGTKEQVVKNYLRSIYDKVGVSDRLELALYTVHHRTLAEAVERCRATLVRSA